MQRWIVNLSENKRERIRNMNVQEIKTPYLCHYLLPDAGKRRLQSSCSTLGRDSGSRYCQREENRKLAKSDWMDIEATWDFLVTHLLCSSDYDGKRVNILIRQGTRTSEDTYRTLMAVDAAARGGRLLPRIEAQTKKLFEVVKHHVAFPSLPLRISLTVTVVSHWTSQELEEVLGIADPMNWPTPIGMGKPEGL